MMLCQLNVSVFILQVHGSGQGLGNDPITGDFIVYVKDVCPECHSGKKDEFM